MNFLREVWYRITDDGEHWRRIKCRIFGIHLAEMGHESVSTVVGGYMWRATGRYECSICHRDLGPVDDRFIKQFPEWFQWHRR